MLRKIVFRFLLICFGFLLIPNSYWHKCEDEHHEIANGESAIDNQHETCTICDFELFQLGNPNQLSFHFSKAKFENKTFHLSELLQGKTYLNFNKGPPNC